MKKTKFLSFFFPFKTFNLHHLRKFPFTSKEVINKSSLPAIPSEKEEDLKEINTSKENFLTLGQNKPQIIFTEDPNNLMDDYTVSPTVLKFDEDSSNQLHHPYQSSTGFNLNTSSELQLKDNPLALQILTEGKIDLKNEKIKLENSSIQDLSLYSLNELKEMNENMAQINVGEIDVLPKNSILLSDIDVYNIPEDKDIIIDSNRKKMIVVGKKVKKTVIGIESDGKDKNHSGEFNVSRNIFEELSFEEFKKKYLFEFESATVKFNKSLFLRDIIKIWPLLVFLYFFIDTIFELYEAKKDHNLVETQQMQIFNKIRGRYMKQIILNNDLYNRANYA